jgi:hypothetical protein
LDQNEEQMLLNFLEIVKKLQNTKRLKNWTKEKAITRKFVLTGID